MISLPSEKDLEILKTFDEPFCLTIYAPYIDPATATNPNRIELKNIVREAETALKSAGVSPRNIKKTLKPARALLEDDEFWPIHHQALALFMHPKLFRYYHIPQETAPYQLTVEKGFMLDPLLQAIADNQDYYVLALSHKNVRLFKGDHFHLKPVHLKNFPSDMKQALNIDEYPKWRETHSIAPASASKGSKALHGQYDISHTDKQMLLTFFRLLDKRLHSVLRTSQLPLVLAGVGYLLPIYQRTNTYQNLVPGGIKGNFEHTNLDIIREHAWSLITQNRGS